MSKISTLLACLCTFFIANAQHVELKQVVPVKYQGISGYAAANGTCDTFGITAANNWLAYYYEYRGGGAVLGTNNLKATQNATILQDANYYDVSSSNYNFIAGGLVYFSAANSNVLANLSKRVIFKIYGATNGAPGALLDSTSLSLSQVQQDVSQGKLTEFKLTTPLAIPASGKFFVAIDHTSFTWSFTNKDSLAIVATDNHAVPSTAFQFVDTSSIQKWYPVPNFWRNGDGSDSLDVSLFVFPYLRTSINSCDVLPVSMFNFGGFIKDYQAYLNWSTATESNNKGFYIERSKDGRNFTSIGFVNGAGNSSQIKNYTYTDGTLKDINVSTTYYRLRQVDLDGKSTYSNVLSLDLKNIFKWRVYPNPIKNIATIELNLTATSKVNVQLIARDGRVLINADKGILNQGQQQIFVSTQGLAKGSYIIKVKTDNETFSMPVMKD